MVDCSSSKRSVWIRFPLAIELVYLIGRRFPCRGKGCRIEPGLTRFINKKKGKVAIGKVRYLLNIVFITLRCSNHLFSVKEYSLIGKIRSFKLPVFSSNLSALD